MNRDEEFERFAQWRAEVQSAAERRDIAALHRLSAPFGTVYDPDPRPRKAVERRVEVSRRALTARINRKLARQRLRLWHAIGTGGPDYLIRPWPRTEAWVGLPIPALFGLFQLEGFARMLGVLRDDEFVVEKSVRRSRHLRSLVRRPRRSDGMEDLLAMGVIVDTGRRRNGRPVYALTSLGKKLTAHEGLLERLQEGAPDLSQPIEWAWEDDLENLSCDFDVVPSDNDKWFLWWRDEQVWIASFPSREDAKRILSGDWAGLSGDPGWPRATYGDVPAEFMIVDVPAALYAHREKHGRFPQIALNANSTLVELFTRIDNHLALTLIGQLMAIEADAIGNLDPGAFYRPVTQHLHAGGYESDRFELARFAPWFTRLLIRVYAPKHDDDKYGPSIPANLTSPVTAWLTRIGREDLIKLRD